MIAGALGLLALGMAVWMTMLWRLEDFDDLPRWAQLCVVGVAAVSLTAALVLFLEWLEAAS
jgi:uncharacterized membrane protein YidH (DUF202 family)